MTQDRIHCTSTSTKSGQFFLVLHIPSKKVFMGSSLNPGDEFRAHVMALEARIHPHQELQSLARRHGHASLKLLVPGDHPAMRIQGAIDLPGYRPANTFLIGKAPDMRISARVVESRLIDRGLFLPLPGVHSEEAIDETYLGSWGSGLVSESIAEGVSESLAMPAAAASLGRGRGVSKEVNATTTIDLYSF